MAEQRSFANLGYLGLALAAVILAGIALVLTSEAQPSNPELSVQQAHEQAVAGDIWLIDIRQPMEWKHTGIGEGAHPIDMRRPDFLKALSQVTASDPGRPIALICAQGVRSSWLAGKLAEVGVTNILNVPEGMEGSAAGPGWVARGLPVRAP